MARRLARNGVLVMTAVVVSCSPAAEAVTPAVPAALVEALQQRIDTWSRRDTHHGVSASVVLADGAQWSGVAGTIGEGRPLRADHLIQIGSITKTMTAGVVLQLVDEGVLRLEDSVGRWLETSRNIDRGITIRQLLNHTSGVANYTGAGAELGRAVEANRNHVFTPEELLGFVGAPRFAPGSRTEYTNTSFLLLGQIAERATGRRILELYRQRLFEPLGLDATFLPGLEDLRAPVAPAFSNAQAVDPLEYLSLLSIGHSAFGLMSNAATIARWGHALFAGNVVSERMQLEMRSLVPAAGNIQGEAGTGLGIRGYEYLGRQQFGHSGGATFGSSLLLFDPQSGVTVAVLMNQGQGADHFSLAPALLELATRP